jgi:septal ring factor EnvC (AmiA/AmiB activator)
LINIYNQIDEAEAELLKSSYRRLQEDYLYEKRHEEKVQRRIISIQNEILDEKINIEKAHMDEAEEARHLANTGEVRKSMQQQLEFAEQRDTITKFELVELKRLHDDLAKSLANMKDQNSSLVDPILDSLKKEVI